MKSIGVKGPEHEVGSHGSKGQYWWIVQFKTGFRVKAEWMGQRRVNTGELVTFFRQ